MIPNRLTLRNLILFGAIPAVALSVAARQMYHSKFDTLSTWKGGGMGMFASADNSDTRLLRIWMAPPGGERHPVIGLTSHQKLMRAEGLWYPSRERFASLAKSLQTSKFVAQKQRLPVQMADPTGKSFTPTGRSLLLLSAAGPRPPADRLNWEVRVEYWQLRYDPELRHAKLHLAASYTYPAGE